MPLERLLGVADDRNFFYMIALHPCCCSRCDLLAAHHDAVVLQKQLQPGRLTLEGYLRCTVFYQGEDGAGLCQTEQKLPFTKQLEVPEFSFTSWTAR